jgi:hypothetical protein
VLHRLILKITLGSRVLLCLEPRIGLRGTSLERVMSKTPFTGPSTFTYSSIDSYQSLIIIHHSFTCHLGILRIRSRERKGPSLDRMFNMIWGSELILDQICNIVRDVGDDELLVSGDNFTNGNASA